jgi:hypothetical protein
MEREGLWWTLTTATNLNYKMTSKGLDIWYCVKQTQPQTQRTQERQTQQAMLSIEDESRAHRGTKRKRKWRTRDSDVHITPSSTMTIDMQTSDVHIANDNRHADE